MFQPVREVARTADGILKAEPFLGALASRSEPARRHGRLRPMSTAASASRPARSTISTGPWYASSALEDVLAAESRPIFPGSELLSGEPPDPRQLRALPRGQADPRFRRARSRGWSRRNSSVRARKISASCPAGGRNRAADRPGAFADEEFATVEQGSGLNGALTAIIVLFIIWRALKSMRIVARRRDQRRHRSCGNRGRRPDDGEALNLISVAFAVLFVGIGVDFGIQFSVRYRAERMKNPTSATRCCAPRPRPDGRWRSQPRRPPPASIPSLPTDYRGVSELGLIAGTGMIIAFFTSITVLPALADAF